MTQLKNILVPTDLSEPSRRALVYGCWLASENKASLMVMHVANEFQSWQLCSEDLMFIPVGDKWPADRVLAEAGLDLSRFLEPSLAGMRNCRSVSKRVVLGAVAQQIAAVAEEENADLVIMAPSRRSGLRRLLFGSITGQVTRLSPCPVLSITEPLPSQPWRGKLFPDFPRWPRPKMAGI